MRPITILLLVLLGGCEYTPQDRQADRELNAEVRAEVCRENVQPLLDSLKELDSRLAVGMAYAEYGERIGDVRVRYDALPIAELGRSCIRQVGVHLEEALNYYVEALSRWGDCIEDLGCDIDGIQPELQRLWGKATRRIAQAEGGLGEIADV